MMSNRFSNRLTARSRLSIRRSSRFSSLPSTRAEADTESGIGQLGVEAACAGRGYGSQGLRWVNHSRHDSAVERFQVELDRPECALKVPREFMGVLLISRLNAPRSWTSVCTIRGLGLYEWPCVAIGVSSVQSRAKQKGWPSTRGQTEDR